MVTEELYIEFIDEEEFRRMLGISRFKWFFGRSSSPIIQMCLNGDVRIDLRQKEPIPDISDAYIAQVIYRKENFKPRYRNGEGHYGEVSVKCSTLDNQQELEITGPSISVVTEALSKFTKAKRKRQLPPDWEEASTYVTVYPQVVNYHHYDRRPDTGGVHGWY